MLNVIASESLIEPQRNPEAMTLSPSNSFLNPSLLLLLAYRHQHYNQPSYYQHTTG